uniref:Uncharacterized protein n=1 Tax=Prolemur simus TaxID=1328070 RepID=A0A8C8ZU85_PROSS
MRFTELSRQRVAYSLHLGGQRRLGKAFDSCSSSRTNENSLLIYINYIEVPTFQILCLLHPPPLTNVEL